MSRCRKDQAKAKIGAGSGRQLRRRPGVFVNIGLLVGITRSEFVEFHQVLIGIRRAENHSFVSWRRIVRPRSQSVAFDAVAQPDASETMTATAATRAKRIVMLLLSICRQLLLRHSPLLRDMNPEMRAPELIGVDQFNGAIVRLDALQYDRQPNAGAANLSTLFAATLEEGLENARALFIRDAGSGIAELEHEARRLTGWHES